VILVHCVSYKRRSGSPVEASILEDVEYSLYLLKMPCTSQVAENGSSSAPGETCRSGRIPYEKSDCDPELR
jgi:hypothetical protein